MQRATSRQLWSILAASHVVCNEGECRGGRGEGRGESVEGRGERGGRLLFLFYPLLLSYYYLIYSEMSPK